MRIGTRRSALALAQASSWRRLLAQARGECELVADARQRRRDASRDARGGPDASHLRPPARARRPGAATDKSRWVDATRGRAARPARSTWPCTPPRTCPASSPRASRCSAPPRAPPPRTCCAARPRWSSWRRARGSARAASAASRSCARRARTSTSSRCAATSTRACASSRTPSEARRDRARARRAAAPGPGGADRRRARPRALRAGARTGRARAGGPRRGRGVRGGRRERSPTRTRSRACSPSARLRGRSSASCHTPLGAHAAPAGCGCLDLRAWVGLPDGSAWVTDELLGGFYDPEALGARGRADARGRRRRAAGARRGDGALMRTRRGENLCAICGHAFAHKPRQRSRGASRQTRRHAASQRIHLETLRHALDDERRWEDIEAGLGALPTASTSGTPTPRLGRAQRRAIRLVSASCQPAAVRSDIQSRSRARRSAW